MYSSSSARTSDSTSAKLLDSRKGRACNWPAKASAVWSARARQFSRSSDIRSRRCPAIADSAAAPKIALDSRRLVEGESTQFGSESFFPLSQSAETPRNAAIWLMVLACGSAPVVFQACAVAGETLIFRANSVSVLIWRFSRAADNRPKKTDSEANFIVAFISVPNYLGSMIRHESARAQEETAPLDIREVRAELILRGLSLSAWARGYGKASQYVQLAVRGKRRGPIARRIVAALKAELGL